MERRKQNRTGKNIFVFLITSILLLIIFLWAVNTGSIKLTALQLYRGLFIEFDENVAAVYDLRFPRIIIAILVGAALSVSGVLLQAVLKNPLTDPGILGISGGAGFVAAIFTIVFPASIYFLPMAAFVGGIAAFFLVYSLAWKQGLSPLRIILVGVSVSTVFSGLSEVFQTMGGQNQTGAASIVNGTIAMKTWEDVKIAIFYIPIMLLISFLFIRWCNLLALDEQTVRAIGINVTYIRMTISIVAVLLASIASSIAGTISFLGLIVPHISRILVGTNHRVLLPYSGLLGATIFLFADTVGRVIAFPYEISASVIMAVAGGPFFILLLRRSEQYGS
ncbi:FecCD family ABC transporter permease [Velocimicrobium porci]|uniref:Probable heme-iron transport system permease protein IsdF n=1 Tax=Velocimicrobium porci TaxID=2606634 RepID=A0A6L5XXG0_9FIRM|nr:iron ABC transporter permease [Velocimicrobium porci]MSS63550.1 iron ABC transporter permease [Velocimicrobium porci]